MTPTQQALAADLRASIALEDRKLTGETRLSEPTRECVRSGPGYFAHLLPAPKPTLRDLAIRAVQTDAALTALYEGQPDEATATAAEDAASDARFALLVALGKVGIDVALAGKIGRLL